MLAPRALALASLLVLSSAGAARADPLTNNAVGLAEALLDIFAPWARPLPGALAGAAGQATESTLTAASGFAGNLAGAAMGYAGADGNAVLLASSGPATGLGRACSSVIALGDFTARSAEPGLTLLVSASPGSPEACPAWHARWTLAELEGSWEQGWSGVHAGGGQVERIALGPYGDGSAIALTFTVEQAGRDVYRLQHAARDWA